MAQTVLLPVDLSSHASWDHSLPEALRLAKGGTLHVVTVLPAFGMSMVGGYFDEGFAERALHDLGENLKAWVNDHVPDGQEVHPHVTHGRVYDEILRVADRLGVDVIVLAAHTPDFSDYLLGPNAARVVRHAKQSVYVVRG